VVISILRDSVARRVLSVSATNQPNQYEVTYTVAFSVTAGDRELLPPQEVSETRTYSFDERLLLARGHEEDILRRDMAHNLAGLVMRRLASL
jgi:LPS-assembly lipoprotein